MAFALRLQHLDQGMGLAEVHKLHLRHKLLYPSGDQHHIHQEPVPVLLLRPEKHQSGYLREQPGVRKQIGSAAQCYRLTLLDRDVLAETEIQAGDGRRFQCRHRVPLPLPERHLTRGKRFKPPPPG
ncbi:hypothetical protein D3C81_1624490 [compost metagenome]